ncbi:MAG: EAL domain-containing protein [Proteobacteria bacterium]|nr:EAL domain-containing protein [Pseudomonadota bacterium]
MRSITGWRFLLVIALPMFLALLGVVTLAFDLLDRISSNANTAEYNRNRDLVVQALKASEIELGHLTRDNAAWDDAFANTVPSVNTAWFESTWGQFNAAGTPYDIVAVLDPEMTRPEAIASRNGQTTTDVAAYLGAPFAAMLQQVGSGNQLQSYATTLAETPDGPVIAALATITQPSTNSSSGKQLLMIRQVNLDMLDHMERTFLLKGLAVVDAEAPGATGVVLHDIGGQPAFAIQWQDKRVGESMTGWAKQKASVVLAFLIVVMTGITAVCWRLIRDLVRNETQARHAATHDALTGLPNRAAAVERMRALRDAKVTHLAVAFADLDGFKEVNDAYGHEVGDRLIRAAGAGISKLANESEIFCRMGGDEFVVLFSGTTAIEKAKAFSDNLIRFLAEPFEMEGRIMSVGASIGIATTDGEELDELEILRRADIAMYKAKADGKNRSCVYNISLDATRIENLAIASELRSIIAAGNLDIAFQPVISARSGRLSGVEALCRWPQSSLRQVPPDRFVAVAETSGLIDDLGEAVLNMACAAARNWPELRLAVNISAVQLNNPRFVERSLAVIERHGLKPRNIEFEITETSLIRDADRARQVFKQLQLAGIKVALDDFGTGFSSIGYLRTFKFDRIKIDKSIVNQLLTSPAELAIVQGTLLVARGLSADVTAEGVEYEDEVNILRLAGCTELQGYYYYGPLPTMEIDALVGRMRQPEAASLRGAA